jgi:hypothetical protein
MLAWPYAELRLGAKGATGVPEDLQALLLWQWQVCDCVAQDGKVQLAFTVAVAGVTLYQSRRLLFMGC